MKSGVYVCTISSFRCFKSKNTLFLHILLWTNITIWIIVLDWKNLTEQRSSFGSIQLVWIILKYFLNLLFIKQANTERKIMKYILLNKWRFIIELLLHVKVDLVVYNIWNKTGTGVCLMEKCRHFHTEEIFKTKTNRNRTSPVTD